MTTIKLGTAISNIYENDIVRRIASNFGWTVVSEAIGRGVFFITNIYLARTLGVSNFGLFTLAQTLILFSWLVVGLGTSLYGIREIAKDKENAENIINPILTLRILSGLAVFSLYMVSLFFIDMSTIEKLTFVGAGLYLITYSFYTDWILKGLEKFKYIVFGNLISSIAFFTGVVFFVRGSQNVATASFVWGLSYSFGSLSLFIFVFRKLGIKYKPSINLKIWLFHLKESIHFTFSSSLMALYQYLPILLLGVYFTSYEIGLFSAPYRIVITVCSAGFLLPMAFYPVFSELYNDDRTKFHNTQKKFQIIMIVIGLPIAIIGTVFSDKIIELFFGNQYLKGITVFKIIVWLVPLYFLRFTFGSLLFATGRQILYSAIAAISITILFMGFFLIKGYGLIGLSFLLLISDSIIVVLLAYFFYKKT